MINKYPHHSLYSATFFTSFVLLVISLLKVAMKHSAKLLCSVPKHKKAVMCLMENTCVRLCSGLSYSALHSEQNVNASIVYVK